MGRHIRALLARDRHQPHRAATQLELFFDLVIVVAIAAAAHGLRHELAHGHAATGLVLFFSAFFAVWWPWNCFTWFASSFDNDDAGYRINVMAIMFGAMFVAAGMPGFFAMQDLTYTYVGYLIMRCGSAALWLRAGRANPEYRTTAKRYAVGQLLLQIPWGIVAFAVEPGSGAFFACFGAGALAELLVPWIAERARPTSWHRHHIIERFGLLNIIVLGEVLLGSTHALTASFGREFHAADLEIPLGGAVIALCMWWIYFAERDHLGCTDVRHAFEWAYGHFFVFAAGAGVGAGLGAMIDAHAAEHGAEHGAAGPSQLPNLAVAGSVAIYVTSLWLVRDRHLPERRQSVVMLALAALVAATGLLPHAPVPTAVLLAATLIARLRMRADAQEN